MVSRVINFVRNIIDLDRLINIRLATKSSLKIGMGMDNAVTALIIK